MFEHLTLISALLGGFAFTFLGAILSNKDNKKIVSALVVLSAFAATIFFLCTIGWAFFVKSPEYDQMSDLSKSKHKFLSLIFFLGIFLFNVVLGMSGWLRSKKVGIITVFIGVFALVSLLFLFKGSIS